MPDPNKIDPSMLSKSDQANFMQSDEQRAESTEDVAEKDQEIESVAELQERISRELRDLFLLPIGVSGGMNAGNALDLFTTEELLEALADMDSISPKIENARRTNNGKFMSGLDLSDTVHRGWKEQVAQHSGLREQWNLLSNYDKIIFTMIACLDSKQKIHDAIRVYLERTIKTGLMNYQSKLQDSKTKEIFDQTFSPEETEVLAKEKSKRIWAVDKNAPYINLEFVYETMRGLIEGIRGARVFDNKSILEIGGDGLAPLLQHKLSGTPDKYTGISSRFNENEDYAPKPEEHVTSKNYQEIFGDQTFDVTITRCVFEHGSGISKSDHRPELEAEATKDLLYTLGMLTKSGGFSIHEGVGTDFPPELITAAGFERVAILKLDPLGDSDVDYSVNELKKLIDDNHDLVIQTKADNWHANKSIFQQSGDRFNAYTTTPSTGFIAILRKI